MAHTKWISGWGTSSTVTKQTMADYFDDTTFRYVMFPNVDASKVRLHFTNRLGKQDATLTSAYIAKVVDGMKIDESTNTKITFGGADSVVLVAGKVEDTLSDELDFEIKAGENYAVSLYFADMTHMYHGHTNAGAFVKKYFTKGNFTTTAELPLVSFEEAHSYVFLHTIDFLTSEENSTIVAFGDSITAQPWPDYFARRLYENGITNRAVIRRGIGGSRVLREYEHRARKHFGETGIKRFERDIDHAGVDRIFILHGINDLIHPGGVYSPMSELPTAEEIIAGYKEYISIARRLNKKVYISTILPTDRVMKEDGMRDKIRCTINEWIKSTDLIDGYIDFEAAVWDENDHKKLKAEYDSGDHLHPSNPGASAMANSIPLNFATE